MVSRLVQPSLKAVPSDETGVKSETPSVKEALFEAEKALTSAQDAVELVPTLPSAYPPHPVNPCLSPAGDLMAPVAVSL